MSTSKWIALSAVAVLAVGFTAYPLLAGSGSSSGCGSDKAVASVDGQPTSSCGAHSARQVVASVDGDKGGSCGSHAKNKTVAGLDGKKAGSCGSHAHKETVASVDGKCCGCGKKAVAAKDSKSCPAKADGVLLSVDAKACGSCDKKAQGKCPDPAGRRLQNVLAYIDQAEKAMKDGHNDKAQAHLAKARKSVHALAHQMMHDGGHKKAHAQATSDSAKQDQAKFVNSKCPIMGKKIHADRVKPALVRTFNGRKVAFCCGGCPGRWDKLSDEQKADKLAKVK
jgi:hypothetical protein